MRIGVIGINHKLATVALREKIAKVCTKRFGANSIHSRIAYVCLSTCNRSEIYFSAEDLSDAHIYLLSVLRADLDDEFDQRVYSYFGIDCFVHLARVTSGLDSAIIGETEIQGQVKQAYTETDRRLTYELHFLFQKCLKIGKQVRSQFSLRRGLPTLEETIYHMGSYYLGGLDEKKILFVGVSRINHKVHSWFKKKNVGELTFCNRTHSKVEGGRHLRWDQLHKWYNYDLAIFGTKCPNYLISNPPQTSSPRLIIDLSVPRNVDPAVVCNSQVKLMNIDQLTGVMEKNRKLKISEVERIEHEIIRASSVRSVGIFNLKQLRKLQGIA